MSTNAAPARASALVGSRVNACSNKSRASKRLAFVKDWLRSAKPRIVRSMASGFRGRSCRLRWASAFTQLDLKRAGEARDHFVLELEQVRDVFLEAVGPEMRAAFGVDELGVDAHPVGVALHRAFEHVAHAELLADRLGVEVLALEGEGGVAGDDEAVVEARQFGGEILGDAVGEIVLGRIVGEVGERQHDDGKTRGLGRRRSAQRRGYTKRPPR